MSAIPHDRAHAGGAFATEVTQLKNTAESTINASTNVVTTGLMSGLNIKELTLDGIAYGLARTVIKSMVTSIVNWINSGFQGSPAFVTDLENYLKNMVGQVIGDAIYGSELAFLCSPFQLDVQLALETQAYKRSVDSYEAQCTLDDIENNIQGFLQGDFTEGGWQNWFELTQGETNDPNKAYYEGQLVLDAKIRNAQGQEIKLLDFGDGFLSFKVCSDTQAQSGSQKNCDITTPGRVISDQLNKALGAGQDQLIQADEINEIIGALIAQLAQQALTGVYGLLGLGGSSSYSDSRYGDTGSSTYLGAVQEEITPPLTNISGIDTTNAVQRGTTIRRSLTSVSSALGKLRANFNKTRNAMDKVERDVQAAFAEVGRSVNYTCSIPEYPIYKTPQDTNFFTDTQSGEDNIIAIANKVLRASTTQPLTEADLIAVVEVEAGIENDLDRSVQNALNDALAALSTSDASNVSYDDFYEFYVESNVVNNTSSNVDQFPSRFTNWYNQAVRRTANLRLIEEIITELDRRFRVAKTVEEQDVIVRFYKEVEATFNMPTVTEVGRVKVDSEVILSPIPEGDVATYQQLLNDSLAECRSKAPEPPEGDER